MKSQINILIRESFKRNMARHGYTWNCFYFADKYPSGNRKKVFKSYGWKGYKKVWQKVLIDLEDLGIHEWSLFEGGSCRGDGSVYGIVKHINKI